MYNYHKIISTPISNNRLNWDERANHTIVVPSLIEGTLDDVQIGNEIAIESDVDGKIVAGKGLKNFVFLQDAKVPTWIMDNHNHAFAFWHEALWKGWIKKGSLLIHIDQHTDLATPDSFPTWKTPEEAHEEMVEEYTNTNLTIADFIVPALGTGVISEAVMITGEDRDGAGVFTWKVQDTKDKGQNIGMLIKKSSVFPLFSSLYPSIIVDIDLDYFSQGFDDAKTLEITKYWIEKADIITIATSPLFIDQDKALSVLKSLQSSLLAL